MVPEPGRRRVAIAVLVALAVAAGTVGIVLGAGGGGNDESTSSVPSAGRNTPRERISFLARLVPPPARAARGGGGAAFPRSVARTARRMSLERKVAQVFVFGFQGTDATAEIFGRMRRLDLGGLVLSPSNYVSSDQLAALAGEAGAVAAEVKHLAPWVFATQEGGELNSFPDLPPATAPADLASAEEAAAGARETAAALRALGVNGVLGPVVDVGGGESGSVLGARVYSDDPAAVAEYAAATTRAYRANRVFSAPKHFPGLGAADQSTEEGPATVGLGLEELEVRDLVPFRAAARAGAPGIVVGHALYPFTDFTLPASLSKAVDTGLLRRQLRFKGVALTDDLADPAITTIHTIPDAAVRALRAGADMLHISGSAGEQQAAYVAVLRAVQRGRIPRARLDQAIGRILVAKQRYKLIR